MSEKISELPSIAKSAVSLVDLLPVVRSGDNYNVFNENLFGGMPKSLATKVVAASNTPNAVSRADYECDGTADDVDIQAAIDALPATGGRVLLLEGTYHISATIELDDDILFEGVGDSTILVLDNAVDDTLLTNQNSTPGTRHGTGNYRINVRNFQVDGNKSGQGAGADTIWCVGFSTVENLRIENLTVIDGWTTGIRTEFCTNVVIANNFVDNSGDDGIAINEETFYAVVSGNIIVGAGGIKTYGAPNGIEIQDGSHDISVMGNICRDCENDGIEISNHALMPANYAISLIGNECRNNTDGIRVAGLAGLESYGITCVGNACSNNTDVGILITTDAKSVIVDGNACFGNTYGIRINGDQCIISSNFLYNNTLHGIYVHTTASYCSVLNNYAADNDIGIAVFGDYIAISGNLCMETAAGVVQRYGIVFYAQADSCRAYLNQFYAHTVANVLDAGTNNYEWLNVGANEGQIFAQSIANVSNPPTDAEIDGIFGTPATVGSGFMGLIDDNNAHTNFWLCVSMGTFWLYEELTRAV